MIEHRPVVALRLPPATVGRAFGADAGALSSRLFAQDTRDEGDDFDRVVLDESRRVFCRRPSLVRGGLPDGRAIWRRDRRQRGHGRFGCGDSHFDRQPTAGETTWMTAADATAASVDGAPGILARRAGIGVLFQNTHRPCPSAVVDPGITAAFLPGKDNAGNADRLALNVPAMLFLLALLHLEFAARFPAARALVAGACLANRSRRGISMDYGSVA